MSDETATLTRYCCPRCGQVLGPPTEDGRIEVTLANGDVWYVVQAQLDCGRCNVRQPVRRDERVVPPFVKEWYPNGVQKGEGENG